MNHIPIYSYVCLTIYEYFWNRSEYLPTINIKNIKNHVWKCLEVPTYLLMKLPWVSLRGKETTYLLFLSLANMNKNKNKNKSSVSWNTTSRNLKWINTNFLCCLLFSINFKTKTQNEFLSLVLMVRGGAKELFLTTRPSYSHFCLSA